MTYDGSLPISMDAAVSASLRILGSGLALGVHLRVEQRVVALEHLRANDLHGGGDVDKRQAQVYAFKDINPKAKVHVLVVPRDHYRNVDALAQADPALLAHMVEVAQGIADDAYNGSYRLIFNTGEDAGQTVFHVHAHVLTGEPMEE